MRLECSNWSPLHAQRQHRVCSTGKRPSATTYSSSSLSSGSSCSSSSGSSCLRFLVDMWAKEAVLCAAATVQTQCKDVSEYRGRRKSPGTAGWGSNRPESLGRRGNRHWRKGQGKVELESSGSPNTCSSSAIHHSSSYDIPLSLDGRQYCFSD